LFRKSLILLSIFITSIYIFSDEVDISLLSKKEILKELESVIDLRSSSIFDYIQSMGYDFPDYSTYEEFILKKVEDIIVEGDLEYPLEIVENLLYVNLENPKSQELYTIILNKNIEIQERIEAEKLKEDIKREQLGQQNDVVNEIYKKDVKLDNIIKMNLNLLNRVGEYESSYNKTHYFSNTYFYPIYTKFYTSDVYDGFISRDKTTNRFSGFSSEFGIGVKLNLFTFKLDINTNFSYNEIFDDNIKQNTSSINLSTGLTPFDFPIYLRTGFLHDLYLFDDMEKSDVAITTLPSPSLGVGILGLNIFKIVKIDLSSDILLASTYTKNLELAMYNRFYLTLNLFRLDVYNFEIRVGFDHIYYNEGGLAEYSLMPKFGLGISQYE